MGYSSPVVKNKLARNFWSIDSKRQLSLCCVLGIDTFSNRINLRERGLRLCPHKPYAEDRTLLAAFTRLFRVTSPGVLRPAQDAPVFPQPVFNGLILRLQPIVKAVLPKHAEAR